MAFRDPIMPRFAPALVSDLHELSEVLQVFGGMLISGDLPCYASSMDIEVGIRALEPQGCKAYLGHLFVTFAGV